MLLNAMKKDDKCRREIEKFKNYVLFIDTLILCVKYIKKVKMVLFTGCVGNETVNLIKAMELHYRTFAFEI